MTTPISSHIKLLEKIFPEPQEDPTLHEMLRQYCKDKGYYSHIKLKEEK
jgi:hypothetical protein